MCTYTTAVAIHVDCQRNPQHRVETGSFCTRDWCEDRPKPGPRCDSPVLDLIY